MLHPATLPEAGPYSNARPFGKSTPAWTFGGWHGRAPYAGGLPAFGGFTDPPEAGKPSATAFFGVKYGLEDDGSMKIIVTEN